MGKKNSYGRLAVRGFQFSGIYSGIKKVKRKDLGLIFCEKPALVSAVFTTNKVKAAPVLVDQRRIRAGRTRAVLVNSGNANACTGQRGLRDALEMTQVLSQRLGLRESETLVSSTGVIGLPLPMPQIRAGIPKLVKHLRPTGAKAFAEAICTTDAFLKVALRKGRLAGKPYTLLGIAKGAGMIAPNMATMLAFIMTDLRCHKAVLDRLFKSAVGESFHRITVDGDTSTNDTAMILASAQAGNKPFSQNSPSARQVSKELSSLMTELALMIVRDGEGATQLVKIQVRGAKNGVQARQIAETIGNSPLVKTSFYGRDPNWGRVLAAAGRSGATLTPEKADIYYNEVCLYRHGRVLGLKADRRAQRLMKKGSLTVTIDLNLGQGHYFLYTSDLSPAYVKLNGTYRS